MKISESRRSFLKKMLAASVFTATCPHILLGKIEPSLKKKGERLQGIYFVSINDYPVLKDIWGSVRIKIPNEYVDGYFGPILVTHVPKEEFGKDFTCVYTFCPHEGREVFDLNEYHEIICSGHGTVFLADGTYITGPAAQDLTKYQVIWDGADGLKIEIPAVISSVEFKDNNLFYLNQNNPNPCSDITEIFYGIEKSSHVLIELYNFEGRKLMTCVDAVKAPGQYKLVLNVTKFSQGTYIYKMQVNSQALMSKALVIYK